MLQEATADLPKVHCESFQGLAVEYARSRKAQAIVRGLRAVSDFEYELKLAEANRHLAPEIRDSLFDDQSSVFVYQFKHRQRGRSVRRKYRRLGPP